MAWEWINRGEYDWVVLTFVVIGVLLAFLKWFYQFQFEEFLRLPFNNKYILIFGKKEKFSFLFVFLFMIIQWLSLSIGVFYSVKICFPMAFVAYWQVLLLVFGSFLLKIVCQNLLIYIFDFKNFGAGYLFNRLSYANYAGLVFAVFNFVTIYGLSSNSYFFYFSWLIMVYLLVFGFVSFVKLYKISIKPHLLYFILYLCTFEIAPYVFLGYALKQISSNV